MRTPLPVFAVLWIVATLTPLTVWSATDEAVTTTGRQFVEQLTKGDYAGAESKFDPTLKAAMPEASLREAWQALLTKAGTFQKELRAHVVRSQGFEVALVSCQFERENLDVKVVFDGAGQVAGLFFINFAPPYAPPSYVTTSAFTEEDFTVGKGKWQLPGTLTLPKSGKGPWPVVVLAHGSGPEDRDETVGGCKPFRDLAWGLASKGIAVLRYVKRTRQHPIKDFWKEGLSNFTVRDETIDDALSAVAQLRSTKDIDPQRIFVLGHSMGGTWAPRIGESDPQIAGLIIMAGSIRPFEEIIVEQIRYLVSLNPSLEGAAYLSKVEADAEKLKKLTAADVSSQTVLFGAPPAYWLDWKEHDPLTSAKQVHRPMFFLQGGRDYQVTEKDFDIWQKGLSAQPEMSFKLYPSLNHLFVTGTGKSVPSEYEQPGHVAEEAVTDIAAWIAKIRQN